MRKSFTLLCVIFLFFFSSTSFSQIEIDSAEIISDVPELTEFHEIIYPMWHDAYPTKDFSALQRFVPQIKEHVKAINNAKLPGILRDKENAWNSQLNALNMAAQNYYDAVERDDNDALLMAAERLHYVFERMMRIIRPQLKEIDDFHQTLYIVYHKLYPDGRYSEITGLANILIDKADTITKIPQDSLKKRLGKKISKYNIAAKELYDATIALKDALDGDYPEKKKEAVEAMHTAYQNLDAVFN
ncbi:MAG: hypothetical protein JXR41_05075 [Bacteroidales bacterium]|nr:hypothetical protein [Bacteroidales bacterium]MBN2762444.1 hypothetical protein [Bacteroidales bacterium]